MIEMEERNLDQKINELLNTYDKVINGLDVLNGKQPRDRSRSRSPPKHTKHPIPKPIEQ